MLDLHDFRCAEECRRLSARCIASARNADPALTSGYVELAAAWRQLARYHEALARVEARIVLAELGSHATRH